MMMMHDLPNWIELADFGGDARSEAVAFSLMILLMLEPVIMVMTG
jgi:hypothetical protein